VAATDSGRLVSLGFAALVLPVAALAAPGFAHAADRAAGTLVLYTDDDNNQIIKPTVAGSVTKGAATARAQVGLDFITSASVDMVTAASPKGFSERRTQIDASGDWDLGEGAGFTAGYNMSHEPDYLTHTARFSGRRDFLARHISLTAGYSFGHSAVGRARDTVFSRRRYAHDINCSLTRIVTADVAADFGLSVNLIEGFQASPYRFVRLYNSDLGQHLTSVTERTPDTRVRQAAVARIRSRLAPALFGHASYRFYADTWGMTGHTLTAKASYTLAGGALILTAEGRWHTQSGVNFYKSRYITFPRAPNLRTGDKELGPMWTALGGLHLEWTPFASGVHALRVGLGADVLHMRYLDFAFLSSRTARVIAVDLSWEI